MKTSKRAQRTLAPPTEVERVEVLVEEPSAEAALSILLPKMLAGLPYAIFNHGSKEKLLRQLPQRLRAYADYAQKTVALVLVDRDDDDCRALLQKLDTTASDLGLTIATRTSAPFHVANRIVIEELEAWYFGDWQAVRAAYPKVPATVPRQAPYRTPDAIKGGTWEALERVLQAAGYFPGGLGKIQAAQEIAPHMDPDRNSSRSFRSLRGILRRLAARRAGADVS